MRMHSLAINVELYNNTKIQKLGHDYRIRVGWGTNMAITIKEAQRLGLLNPVKAKKLRLEMNLQSGKVMKRIAAAAGIGGDAQAIILTPTDSDPQRKIYAALERIHPGIAMWEVEGLVSGRKYRCDIYLPESRVVVEMDGYGPHRSKQQFQADRDKRNLLASTGYIVLAYYYARVKNDIDGVVAQILKTHNFYKPFMTELFKAQLATNVVEQGL